MENKNLYIVKYHYVRELEKSRYPEIKGLEYELFKEQVQFLKKNFTMVTMEDVIEAYNSSTSKLPPNACLLTFDDGYIDNFTYAYPVLKENKIQGSFFIPGKTFNENILLDVNKIHYILANGNIKDLYNDVIEEIENYRDEMLMLPSKEELLKKYAVPSRFDDKTTVFVKRMLQTVLPEKYRNIISSKLFFKYVGIQEDVLAKELYMNRDQIRCMKNDGMFIGIHGYDHYWLGNLGETEMEKDINTSLEVMDEFIDRECWVLNYPYGSYSENVINYISRNGCKLAMTTETRHANETDNRFLLPRLDTNDFPPKSEAYKRFI